MRRRQSSKLGPFMAARAGEARARAAASHASSTPQARRRAGVQVIEGAQAAAEALSGD